MRRIFAVLLCLFLLLSQAAAAEGDSLETTLNGYMQEKGLTEENFAISYYNPATEEQFQFNEKEFFPAGKVWTLPLHMYFCQEESRGTFDPPVDNPDFVYTIDGKTLEECRQKSIFENDRETDKQMYQEVGTFHQYQITVNDRFGHVEETTRDFLNKRIYSTEFLMNCLKELVKNSDVYGNLMREFAQVQTSDALNGYSRPYAMTQVRGEAEGMICAVANVTAPESYLVAAFVSENAGGDEILAEVNDLICRHVEEHAGIPKETTASHTAERRSDTDFQVSAAEKAPQTQVLQWIGIAFGAVAALALLIWLIVFLCRRIRRKKDREE